MSLIPPRREHFSRTCLRQRYSKDEDVEITVDQTVTRLRDEIRNVKELSAIYGISDEPDAQAAERLGRIRYRTGWNG